MDELAYSVYRLLAALNMNEHTLKERFELLQGGLIFHALTEGHDIFKDETENEE